MENCESLLKKASLLKPQEKFLLIDGLIRSIDEPNKDIDTIWNDEAEKRLAAHRTGKTTGISFEDVFGEEI
ncbi:MAG: addiction module protein [Bacteroidota bacterium]|nr:addiction module protein [Bacteroidota bacterium]